MCDHSETRTKILVVYCFQFRCAWWMALTGFCCLLQKSAFPTLSNITKHTSCCQLNFWSMQELEARHRYLLCMHCSYLSRNTPQKVFSGVQVSSKGLRELVRLQHLARLSLKCCTNVNDQALKAVGQITSLTCVICAVSLTFWSRMLGV